MRKHVIKIKVEKNKLSYSARQKRVKQGDEVRWLCAKDYAILFANNASPFKDKTLFLAAKAGKHTRACTVKKPAGEWVFKYGVAVVPERNAHILMDDPHIIIDED